MSIFKRSILLLISVLPLKAIAFAAEQALHVEKKQYSDKEIESIFFKRLNNKVLDEHYYDFLLANDVTTSNELQLAANVNIKSKVVGSFKKDFLKKVDSAGSQPSGTQE